MSSKLGRCVTCSYPLTVRDDGRAWCSVFGDHLWIAGLTRRRPIVFGEFAGLVSELDEINEAQRVRARRDHVRAVPAA